MADFLRFHSLTICFTLISVMLLSACAPVSTLAPSSQNVPEPPAVETAIVVGTLPDEAETPSTAPPSPAELSVADMADIYSTVIRQVYTVDHTFGQPPNFPIIYLIQEDADTKPINGNVQQNITDALADLPAEIIWVDNLEQVPRDEHDLVMDNGAVITVGKFQLQEDGNLHVPASIYVGMLIAGGQTYILEQVNGDWSITGLTGPAWIS